MCIHTRSVDNSISSFNHGSKCLQCSSVPTKMRINANYFYLFLSLTLSLSISIDIYLSYPPFFCSVFVPISLFLCKLHAKFNENEYRNENGKVEMVTHIEAKNIGVHSYEMPR